MGAVKNAFHDEICNRCPECGVGLSECDTLPCDSPVCPIPEPDRVWSTINDKLGRPFGAALTPEQDGRICHPPLITEPTRMIRNKRLRKMMEAGE